MSDYLSLPIFRLDVWVVNSHPAGSLKPAQAAMWFFAGPWNLHADYYICKPAAR